LFVNDDSAKIVFNRFCHCCFVASGLLDK